MTKLLAFVYFRSRHERAHIYIKYKYFNQFFYIFIWFHRFFMIIFLPDFAVIDFFRMLGSMASIIPERKNAHHSIRQSLDSHDNVEVEAAIFAAANFSAQSK